MHIDAALHKLNSLLPLKKRQDVLNPYLKSLYREIILSLAHTGQAPSVTDILSMNKLNQDDLIIYDEKNNKITGAYPFSLKQTPHRILLSESELFAMCAFDAVAIAPVYGVSVEIRSHCYITKDEINIKQNADKIVSVKPGSDIFIGIKWQPAGTCAAENLCMEMIFLKNGHVAREWQAASPNKNIFPLAEAIAFSVHYFRPLIEL
ncbi:MAG: alkylmercury lyase family protein [Gammaproteobacteria bacterium]|nr:alkylmercury lyase family protein [Gammaproteobacteria bacterium]